MTPLTEKVANVSTNSKRVRAVERVSRRYDSFGFIDDTHTAIIANAHTATTTTTTKFTFMIDAREIYEESCTQKKDKRKRATKQLMREMARDGER